MKLIIDISEEYYKQCCESAKSDIGTCTMIANGIPLEQIKAEIKTEMRDYEGDNDFSMGVMYGFRYANTIIDMHIN